MLPSLSSWSSSATSDSEGSGPRNDTTADRIRAAAVGTRERRAGQRQQRIDDAIFAQPIHVGARDRHRGNACRESA